MWNGFRFELLRRTLSVVLSRLHTRSLCSSSSVLRALNCEVSTRFIHISLAWAWTVIMFQTLLWHLVSALIWFSYRSHKHFFLGRGSWLSEMNDLIRGWREPLSLKVMIKIRRKRSFCMVLSSCTPNLLEVMHHSFCRRRRIRSAHSLLHLEISRLKKNGKEWNNSSLDAPSTNRPAELFHKSLVRCSPSEPISHLSLSCQPMTFLVWDL